MEPRELRIKLDGAHVEITAQTAATALSLFTGDLRDTGPVVERERRRWGALLGARIELPPSQCLIRSIDLPTNARHAWPDMLLFDLEHATPFRRDQVYVGWRADGRIEGSTQLERVRQIVIKRSPLEPIMAALASHKVAVLSIEVREGDGPTGPRPIRCELVATNSVTQRLRRNLSWMAAAATALVVIYGVLLYWRQGQNLEQLDDDIARATVEVTRVRKQLGEGDAALQAARKVRLRKLDSVPNLQIWEEVTRLLPGTAWLTDLRIEDGTVSIDGMASSASELVGLFARSTMFREVGFASPVTRDPQRGLERFQIRMRQSRSATVSGGGRRP